MPSSTGSAKRTQVSHEQEDAKGILHTGARVQVPTALKHGEPDVAVIGRGRSEHVGTLRCSASLWRLTAGFLLSLVFVHVGYRPHTLITTLLLPFFRAVCDGVPVIAACVVMIFDHLEDEPPMT